MMIRTLLDIDSDEEAELHPDWDKVEKMAEGTANEMKNTSRNKEDVLEAEYDIALIKLRRGKVKQSDQAISESLK